MVIHLRAYVHGEVYTAMPIETVLSRLASNYDSCHLVFLFERPKLAKVLLDDRGALKLL